MQFSMKKTQIEIESNFTINFLIRQ